MGLPYTVPDLKIRPFEARDLPAVADLYARVARRETKASAGLVAALDGLLLKGPPTPPDLPSLVAEEADAIIGFFGIHVRTFAFDGAPIRLAAGAQLVTDPASRQGAPGLFLMRRFLEGPQDLSVADGATAAVRRMWEVLRGETCHVACTRWTRLLSPLRFAGKMAGRRGGLVGGLARATGPLWAALDVVGRRIPLAKARPPEPYVTPVPLTAETLVAAMPELARGFRLRPDYSLPFAQWLFGALAAAKSRGALHAWAVPGDKGPRGWFLYYLSRDAIASVVSLVAAQGAEDVVLDHLVEHARRAGAVAVQGRLEPPFLPAIARHRSILQYPDAFVLVHSRRPEITHAIQMGRAILTRIDAEYWMSPHLERYD